MDNKIGTPSDTAANDTLFGQMKSITEDVIDAMSNMSGSRMFTKDSEWTVPQGVTKVKITGCAAGGTVYAGAYCYEEEIAVTSGENIPITVGTGNTVFGTYKTLLAANCSTSFQNSKLGYTTGYNGGKGGDGEKPHSSLNSYGGNPGLGGAGGYGGAFGYGGGGGGAGGGGPWRYGGGTAVWYGAYAGGGGGAASTRGNGGNASLSTAGNGYNGGKSGPYSVDSVGGRGGNGGNSETNKGYGSGNGAKGGNGTSGSSGTYQECSDVECWDVTIIGGSGGIGGAGGTGGGTNGFLLVEWG